MRRFPLVVLVVAAVMLLGSPVRQALAGEAGAVPPIVGKWMITHRPVDAAGKPCPYLPENMEISKDHTLVMSNFPEFRMAYKTELSADEQQALAARSDSYKGKQLLLIKPDPRMEWLNTPMVYIYSVRKNVMTLEVVGWETATFKRTK